MLTSLITQMLLTLGGAIVAGAITLWRTRKRDVSVMIAGVVAAFIMLVSGLYLHRAPTATTIRITSPNDGATVEYRPLIRGTTSRADARLYVLVRPRASEVWWVQNTPVVNPDGTWQVPIYLGTELIGKNEPYEIVAVATSANDIGRALQTGDFSPGDQLARVPTTIARSNVIVVRRAP